MSNQRALRAIQRELERQRDEEGYDASHDAGNPAWELAEAARAYAEDDADRWPFDPAGFKPSTRVRNLVKAGALFLAAADRAAMSGMPLDRELPLGGTDPNERRRVAYAGCASEAAKRLEAELAAAEGIIREYNAARPR